MEALLLAVLVLVAVPAPAWRCLDIRCLCMQTGQDPVHQAAHCRPKARSLPNHMLELERVMEYAEYAEYAECAEYDAYDEYARYDKYVKYTKNMQIPFAYEQPL
jgi:hypothetical protein